MPYSKKLHDYLEQASIQHEQLASKFDEFAQFIRSCLKAPSVANNSIVIDLRRLAERNFSATYADRTVTFVFNSILRGDENLVGNVKCYLRQQFPEPKFVEIGEFDFDEKGNTNLKLPNEDADINLDNNFGTLHIALHFIRLSLS
jgi:hypothetical protein